MKCKCPACGAVFSLDVLLQHEQASQAVITALSLNNEFGRLAVQYLGLFRPQKTVLTMERVAKLLNQLIENLNAQRIERNGMVYDAPIQCWIDSLNSVLNNRHSLKLPLTTHNYLYEVITNWQPKPTGLISQPHRQQPQPTNKTTKALQNLAEFANE